MKLDVIMKAILSGEDEETVSELLNEIHTERKTVMIQQGDNGPYFLNLTVDQIRLLNWLIDHDCVYDDFDFQLMDEIRAEEV